MKFTEHFLRSNTFLHQGIPFFIGPTKDKQGNISFSYHVLQDNNEWTMAKTLDLPDDPPDESVTTWLEEHPNFKNILDYSFDSARDINDHPFQVIDDEERVYLLRQSSRHTIYVDQFIFNRENLTLNRAWQVRDRESKQRFVDSNDNLGYEDSEQNPFLWPSIELKLGFKLQEGTFAALRYATATATEFRWQIIALDSSSSQIVSTSLGCSQDHPFDPTDKTLQYSDTNNDISEIKQIEVPGFSQSVFNLKDSSGKALQPTAVQACTYARQEETPENGEIIRTDLHIMIALSLKTSGEYFLPAIVDLEIGNDGIPAIPKSENSIKKLAGNSSPNFQKGRRFNLKYAAYIIDGIKAGRLASITEHADNAVHLYYLNEVGKQPLVSSYDTLKVAWILKGTAEAKKLLNRNSWVNDISQRVFSGPYVDAFSVRLDNQIIGLDMSNALWMYSDRGRAWKPLNEQGDPRIGELRQISTVWKRDGYDIIGLNAQGELWVFDSIKASWRTLKELEGRPKPEKIQLVSTFTDADGSNMHSNYSIIALDSINGLWLYENGRSNWTPFRDNSDSKPGKMQHICAFSYKSNFPHPEKNNRITIGLDEDNTIWVYHWTPYSRPNRWVQLTVRGGPEPGIIQRIAAYADGNSYAIIGLNTEGALWQYNGSISRWNLLPDLSDSKSGKMRQISAALHLSNPHGPQIIGLDEDNALWRYNMIKRIWESVRYPNNSSFDFLVKGYHSIGYGNLTVDEEKNEVKGNYSLGFGSTGEDGLAFFTNRYMAPLKTTLIGMASVNPFLLGYIEGPAPIPSVNLTNKSRKDSYIAMNEVKLIETKGSVRRISSSRNVGINVEMEGNQGFFAYKIQYSYGWLKSSFVSSGQTVEVNHSVRMAGEFDEEKNEFIPENRGLALVHESKAEIYTLSFENEPEKVVAYRSVPIPNSKGVGIHSFKLNSDYVRVGDPKSYYDPEECNRLYNEIKRLEKRREAYYKQYNANAFSKLPEPAQVTKSQFYCSYEWDKAGFTSSEPTFEGTYGSGGGGSFSFLGMAGISAGTPIIDTFKIKALIGGYYDRTVMKNEEVSQTITLNTKFEKHLLDSSNLEPGQYNSYKWYSFFLEQNPNHFDHFFQEVVDRNWLTNHDDAGALRLLMARRRPVWRVKHIVAHWSIVKDLSMFTEETARSLEQLGIESAAGLRDALSKIENGTMRERVGTLSLSVDSEAEILDYMELLEKLQLP